MESQKSQMKTPNQFEEDHLVNIENTEKGSWLYAMFKQAGLTSEEKQHIIRNSAKDAKAYRLKAWIAKQQTQPQAT